MANPCLLHSRNHDGDEPEPTERAAAARGEPRALRAQPALQNHRRGNVRHLRQIRRNQVCMNIRQCNFIHFRIKCTQHVSHCDTTGTTNFIHLKLLHYPPSKAMGAGPELSPYLNSKMETPWASAISGSLNFFSNNAMRVYLVSYYLEQGSALSVCQTSGDTKFITLFNIVGHSLGYIVHIVPRLSSHSLGS